MSEKKYSDDPFHVINTIIILHISRLLTVLLSSTFYMSHSWVRCSRRQIEIRLVKLANTHLAEYARMMVQWTVVIRFGSALLSLLVKHLKINREYTFIVCAMR